MRLWAVETVMEQVFRIAASNDIEALEIFHKEFPVEKEIKSLRNEGYLYTKELMK